MVSNYNIDNRDCLYSTVYVKCGGFEVNICFLCNGFSTNGGIGRVVSILTNELSESGYNILLSVFYERNGTPQYKINPKCVKEVLYDVPISMTKAIALNGAVSRLSKQLSDNQIEIIIACGEIFYPLAFLASKKVGIKYICWEHTSPYTKTEFRFQDICRKIGATNSACNVLLTKFALKAYNDRFPIRNNRQIYNPIDPKLLLKRPEYNKHSKKIITVGRLNPQKNILRLVDIAYQVLKNNSDWQWDVYGDGPQKSEIQDKIKRLKLGNKVVLKGQVSNLYDLYSEYSFLVMTSDYEGFPMTLLEGAANGLPLISFDIQTGPSEIIENGVNGFLCDWKSNDSMIQSIIEMMADEERRTEMSEKSRRTAEQYDVGVIGKQWGSLLSELYAKKS